MKYRVQYEDLTDGSFDEFDTLSEASVAAREAVDEGASGAEIFQLVKTYKRVTSYSIEETPE